MKRKKFEAISSLFRIRVHNISSAVKILFSASKKYFIIYWVLSLVMALMPFIPLIVWKNLLNVLSGSKNRDAKYIIYTIITLAVTYCIAVLLEKYMNTYQQIISYKYNDEIDYYVDNLLIDTVVNADLAFFDSSKQQDNLNNILGLIGNVTKNIPQYLFATIEMFMWTIISLIIIWEISPILSVIILLLSIPGIIGDKHIDKRNYTFRKKNSSLERKLGYYQSLFQGNTLFEIKLFNLSGYFSSLYNSIYNSLRNEKIRHSMINCVVRCISVIFLSICDIILYAITLSKVIVHEIMIGDITYYVSILSEFRSRFISLFNDFNSLLELSDEFTDICEFLEQEPLIQKSGTLIPSDNPEINFHNVSFKYPNTDINILNKCSFVISPGETVGIVGLNGAGKSTIVKLLCRFYDPTEGEILIDGINIKEYDIISVRKLFGVLFQDYVKYALTLRENIALSDIQRLKNDNEIQEAAEQSRVLAFFEELEHGLDENMTRMFDPNGKELSGGQWQRVSLARTFFRNAPIVLLDEPSAALDPIAEHEIFNDFKNAYGGKSALLISHRLSSITMCDKILVLSNGKIIEEGSHNELIREHGEYARLFQMQASKYEI